MCNRILPETTDSEAIHRIVDRLFFSIWQEMRKCDVATPAFYDCRRHCMNWLLTHLNDLYLIPRELQEGHDYLEFKCLAIIEEQRRRFWKKLWMLNIQKGRNETLLEEQVELVKAMITVFRQAKQFAIAGECREY